MPGSSRAAAAAAADGNGRHVLADQQPALVSLTKTLAWSMQNAE